MNEPPCLVCIVDDDPSVRRSLGRVVNTFGFETKLFASARQCLDAPHIGRAACLILDVSMPNLDGFELHALLCAQGHHVPTIFISGIDSDIHKSKAKTADSVAFLSKPCDVKLLHEAILKAVAIK